MITITTPITDADLALMEQIVNSCSKSPSECLTPTRKRNRYDNEISNIEMSRLIGVKIGNKEFCEVARRAKCYVTYHGTHPYIRRHLKNQFTKVYHKQNG